VLARTPQPLASLAALALLASALAGCGAGRARSGSSATTTSAPAYVSEPPTHQQLLVEQGARLIVADGCSACHLAKTAGVAAPAFASFAGNRVTLADGRRALVDEQFLRDGLSDPARYALRGYSAASMVAAVRRLRLARKPAQIVALAAFIEEIGPEPE
jgi:hypothetical protein